MTTGVIAGNPVEARTQGMRQIVLASALGTVFEWYDFFIYGSLAVFFGGLFFPKGNESAAMLASLATFGAGFVLRPFGAIVFGKLGDTIGRKYTFLATLLIMGLSTAVVGLLPTYEKIGWAAPVLLVTLRLLQGLAVGGEFGGAVTYISEHAQARNRGVMTSMLQITGTIGLLLSLLVIMGLRSMMQESAFAAWGWRIPFLLSIALLMLSLYIRLKLGESPLFVEMKAHGKQSKNPIRDTFGDPKTFKLVVIAIFGVVAGQAVVWYTAHFYSLYFLTATLKLDYTSAYLYLTIALVLGTPFFVIFGALSDRIGRKWVMLSGCLLSALLIVPIFHGLAAYANPALTEFRQHVNVVIEGEDCQATQSLIGQTFNQKATKACERAKAFLSANAVPYTVERGGGEIAIVVNGTRMPGFDEAQLKASLVKEGLPTKADPSNVNGPAVVALLFALIVLTTMIYGPLGAFLVELFPTHVRYSGVSVSLQFGNGWIGGFAPLIATAVVLRTGDIFAGLLYTVGIAAVTFILGGLLLRETRGRDMSS
ncbi:MFS family permease [Paraburkholderia terricola]|uniref:MFS transporter n=1 Tax=Paraburkholderia terricola TaxID=169427 RepID=UPI00285955FE|nr:MFS transporter [Paraburkholderia terricola]MDR6495680.1 MFS family permease [Paraburkholderia terricola]